MEALLSHKQGAFDTKFCKVLATGTGEYRCRLVRTDYNLCVAAGYLGARYKLHQHTLMIVDRRSPCAKPTSVPMPMQSIVSILVDGGGDSNMLQLAPGDSPYELGQTLQRTKQRVQRSGWNNMMIALSGAT